MITQLLKSPYENATVAHINEAINDFIEYTGFCREEILDKAVRDPNFSIDTLSDVDEINFVYQSVRDWLEGYTVELKYENGQDVSYLESKYGFSL